MSCADCRALLQTVGRNINAIVFGTCSKDVMQRVDTENKRSAGNLSRMGSRNACDSANKLPLSL